MRRALRHVLALLGVSVIALVSPVWASAAIHPPQPAPRVVEVSPDNGATVGVGMPITVTYAGAVADRPAAERSISVVSPAKATGRFEWLSDNIVQWTPDQFWPAHSQVKASVGAVPLGGFFCNGEIGPVNGTTYLHGYTSCFGLFRPKP